MSDIASLKIVIDSKEVGTALTRLKELETQAGRTAKAVSGGANSLEASAARAAKPTVTAAKASSMLSRELNKLSGDSTAASTGLVKVEQEAERLSSAAEASKMKFSDLSASLRKLITTLDPVNRAASDTRAAVSLLVKAEADGAISSKQFELAHRELTRELAATTGTKKQAAVATEELNAAMQRFLNKADPLGQKIKQLKTELVLWKQKKDDNIITDREYLAVIKKLYSDLAALTGRKKEVKEQTVKLTASMRSLLATVDPLGAKIAVVREKMAALVALEDKGHISTLQYNAALRHLYSTLGATAKASDNMARAAKKSNIAISGLEEGFRTLRSAVVGYVGLQGVQFLASVADEATNVRNRLRAVTSSTGELNSVFNDLARVSANARVDLQTSANLYQRMTMGTEHLGLSQEKLIRLTETIGKSFKISGATADEASGSIRQLTQAFNANMLRGEELNSINEQAPILMKAIQRELGMTGKELRDFAETGGITADIMVSAFTSIEKEVDELFGQTTKTIEDNITDIRRQWVVWSDQTGGVRNTLQALTDTLSLLSSGLMALLEPLDKAIGYAAYGYKEYTKLAQTLLNASGTTDLLTESTLELKVALKEAGQEGGWLNEVLARISRGAENVSKWYKESEKSLKSASSLAMEKSIDIMFQIEELKKARAGAVTSELDAYYANQIDELTRRREALLEVIKEEVGVAKELTEAHTDHFNTLRVLEQEALTNAGKRDELFESTLAGLQAEAAATQQGADALLRYKAAQEAANIAKKLNKQLAESEVKVTEQQIELLTEEIFSTMKAEEAIKAKARADKEAAKAKKEADKATKDALEVLKKDFEERKKATYELEKALQAARQEMQNMAMEFMRSIDPSIAKLEELNKEAQGVGAAFSLGLIDEAQFKSHITRITTDMDRVKNGLETIEESADRIAGAFASAFSAIGDELGGFGKDIANAIGSIGEGMLGSKNLSFMDALAQNAPQLGVALGGMIGSQGSGRYSGLGSSLGSALGMMTPLGPFGAMIGGVLGGAVGGMIGPKPSDMTQSSLLDFSTGRISAAGFTGEKFSSENATQAALATGSIGALADQLADQFGSSLKGSVEFVVGSRDGIRVQMDQKWLTEQIEESFERTTWVAGTGRDGGALGRFETTTETRIVEQTKKFETIADAIDAVAESMLTTAGVSTGVYNDLRDDNETLAQAYNRLSTQSEIVSESFDLLNLNFTATGDEAVKFADSMVQIAGGIDAFVQAANTYYDKFFTEQEKQEDLFESLTKSFADLGYEVPKSRSAYRQLVESADAETAQLLIGMSGNLDRFLTSRESFAAKITDAYENILGREPDLAGFEYWITRLESGQITINDFIEGLSTSAEKLAKDKKDAYLTDPDNTFVVDMGNKSFNNLLDSVKNSIEYAKEYAKAINEFSTTMARDAELSGMSAEDKDITNLRVWRDGLIAQLDALAAGGGLSKSNYESILNDIETQYLNGLSDINSKYNKIDDSAEKLLEKLNEQAKDFTSGLAIDAAFEGLEGKEADLFKLEQWYSNTISKLNQLIADGATIEGGVEAAMANITKIYDIRLGNINQSYYEKVAEDYAKMEEDLADKVANAKDTVIDAYDRELEALITFTDKMSGLSDQLRGYAQSLLTSDLSPLSPAAQLQAARSQFMDVSRRARLGDTDAMSQLTGVSDTFLRESREFQGSAGTYASDFQMVQEAVNAAADVADRQKDQGEVQIEQLKMQVQGLSDVKNEVITLQEALAALIVVQQESAKELQRQGNTLDGLKSNSDLELSA